MENAQRISTVSRRLRMTCTCLLFGLPALNALFWIFFNQIYFFWAIQSTIPLPVPVKHHLGEVTRFLGFLVGLIPLAATLYGVQILRELFTLYEGGSIFKARNVGCIRRLGWILIVWVVCEKIRWSLLSIVLTLENPPGQRLLVVSFSGEDFTWVFVGIVVLTISWVMDEARKLEEDQALIV